ncbi:MAG TPA: hypothetical protein VFA09_18765 [Ktedonobacteraceae bacterium]|nr:hypothetical protein [Ktedonobacteraceae bacterium]
MKKLWQMFFLSIGLFLLVCSQGDLVQAAPVSSGSWKIIASSNPPGDDSLFAVAAISLNDAWAVGSSGQDGPSPMTLTEHFNGTQWSVIPSPNPGPSSNKLYSVAATTMNDVWAVGYSYNSPPQTLILHYDGTQWSVIASPSPGSFNNQLLSVSAISAHDAWAVGYAASNTTTQALIEHYNGSSWEVIPGPALSSSYYELDAVTALSSTNVVAVGSFINQQGNSQALIEHWNGSRWKVLSGPNPGSSSRLNGVVAVSSSDIWAVGEFTPPQSNAATLIEHFDGNTWQVVSSPNRSALNYNGLVSVTALSASDVWAVGQSGISNGDAPHGSFSQSQVFPRTLIEHFDGSKWRIAASPNLGTSDTLTGVSSVSGTGHAWAVGSYYNSAPPVQTLTEFYG